MSRHLSRAILAAFLVTAAALPAAVAHHSYVTKYDSAKLTRLTGTVGSVSYTNPHIFFQFEAGGTSWSVETESISVARANGLTEAILTGGAKATITGWPSREKSAELGLSTITFEGRSTITMRRTAR
mgnify:CR=1 FL=1